MSKHLRLLKASSYYPEYVTELYAQTPGLNRLPYAEQLRHLLDSAFGLSDVWSCELGRLGTYTIAEVVMNARPLQRQWAIENAVAFSEDGLDEILLSQVERFAPEVVFLQDFPSSSDCIARLRAVNSVRFIVAWDGTGLAPPSRFDGIDLVIAPNRLLLPRHAQAGRLTLYMPLGFDTRLLQRIRPRERFQLTFVGSVFVAARMHNQRLRLLGSLTDVLPLTLFVSGLGDWRPWRWHQRRRLLGFRLREFLWAYRIARRNRGPRFGRQMYEVLAGSDITLNTHIDVSGNVAANFRLFEATGMGACLLTDAKENISEFFEPGREVATYASAEECLEKCRWLLQNDGERRSIAAAGQDRTIRDHNQQSRLTVFDKFLRSVL